MFQAIVLLLIAISFSVAGEIMLKHGMNNVGVFSMQPDLLVGSLVRSFTNPFVVGGFAVIFTGSIFWLSVISRVPLSFAYPMLSLSYVIGVFAAWLILGEELSLTKLAGVGIIVVGVYVVSRS